MAEPQQNGAAEVAIPACLEKESLQKVLRESEKCDDLEIITVDVTPGSNIGDNYLAIMYAVEIEARKSGVPTSYSIMAKVIPNNSFRQQMLADLAAFKKEISVYQDVFPALADFEKSRGFKTKGFTAYPRVYYTHYDGKTDYMLMHNLKQDGFKMADRIEGLDYPHCKLVLEQLALLHAQSYAFAKGSKDLLLQKFPLLKEMFTDIVNKDASKYIDPEFTVTIGKVRATKKYDDIADGMQKLLDLSYGMLEACHQQVEKVDDGYAVICHGDCWVNNMLFKYGPDGTVQETKLVDFQIARAGSRALDLVYFFCISTTEATRKSHQDQMFQDYHDTFVGYLNDAGVDSSKFTLEGLKKEYHDHFLFGFLFGCMLLPAITQDAENIPDMETLTEEDIENFTENEQFQKFFSNPRLMGRLLPLLKEARARDIFSRFQ